ncbi:hypothetical protein HYH03_005254 [Edaphochlamys debaryana]|uniref:Uncharacterized protein n=1 Tax=Edaphochlamys debaryana TaxID=47281 RepID=A0A835YDK7_9CHLO|nr:hypothetical protein HYH03_005254 [Edaphochlamys debaryana]|eukprot:KAG2496850.1 hypothetical protein HYH03_005254 [Edaphochlamys debaryana]
MEEAHLPSRPALLCKSALTTDVTAVHVVALGPQPEQVVVLTGCGPNLSVHRLYGGELLAVHRVLSGCRIHGITALPDPHAAAGHTQPSTAPAGAPAAAWVVVYGDRWVQILRLHLHQPPPAGPAAASAQLALAVALPPRPAWVLAAHLQPVPTAPSPPPGTSATAADADAAAPPPSVVTVSPVGAAAGGQFRAAASAPPQPPPMLLVLALADNSAEVWRLTPPPSAVPLPGPPPAAASGDANGSAQTTAPLAARRLLTAVCSAPQQLLAAALLPLEVAAAAEGSGGGGLRIWVAAGTVFNEVLLWRLPLLPYAPYDASRGAPGASYDWPYDEATSSAVPYRARALAERYDRLDGGLRRLAAALGAAAPSATSTSSTAILTASTGPGPGPQAHLPSAGMTKTALPSSDSHSPAPRGGGAAGGVLRVTCGVRCTLRGHEGSIFHVAWIPPAPLAGSGSGRGWRLLSASDDRSARLWEAPDLREPSANRMPPALAPALTLWGHTCRVWCCTALWVPGTAGYGGGGGGGARLVLVTGSEDCSVRLWAANGGRCLRVLQGHRGRGVWCCALQPSPAASEAAAGCGGGGGGSAGGGGVLTTGGADGTVRLWALAEALAGAPPLPSSLPSRQLHGAAADEQGAAAAAGASASAAGKAPRAAAAPAASGSRVVSRVLRPPSHGKHGGAPPPAAEGIRCLALQAAASAAGAGSGDGGSGGGSGSAADASGGSGALWLYAGTYGGAVYRVDVLRAGPDGAESAAEGAAPPGPGGGGGGGGGWRRLYDDAGQGSCTCLTVCPLPPDASIPPGLSGGGSGGGGGGCGVSGSLAPPPTLLAVGHNSGTVAVIQVANPPPCTTSGGSGSGGSRTDLDPVVTVAARWRATAAGSVIGAWWTRALGRRVLLTVGGDAPAVRLWRLPPPPPPSPSSAEAREASEEPAAATLAATARSPLKGRLLVADVCGDPYRVLLAGDQYGNLMAFWAPPAAWDALTGDGAPGGGGGELAAAAAAAPELVCVAVFRAALGSAAASWVAAAAPSADAGGRFVAAGRDGILARYRCCAASATAAAASVDTPAEDDEAALSAGLVHCPVRLECTGTVGRTGVSSIEMAVDASAAPSPANRSASGNSTGGGGGGSGTVVAGFHGSEFLAVSLSPDPSELLRVPSSGGWRRPHAVALCGGGGGGGGSAGGGGGGVIFAYVGDGGAAASVHVVRRLAEAPPPPLPLSMPQAQPTRGAGARQVATGEAGAEPGARDASSALLTLPRSLLAGHHGREVLCVLVLPPSPPPPPPQPSAAAAAAPQPPLQLVILTGAEDGSIRRLTAMPVAADTCSRTAPARAVRQQYGLLFADGAPVGEHAAGTAVRCLVAAPLAGARQAHDLGLDLGPSPGSCSVAAGSESGSTAGVAAAYLVFSAGAKEVLMAWLVTVRQAPVRHESPVVRQQPLAACNDGESGQGPQASGPGAPAVEARWVSTRHPPRAGLRPRAGKDAAATAVTGERRFLALALLGVHRGSALLAAAASDATASLITWGPSGGGGGGGGGGSDGGGNGGGRGHEWRTAAALEWHQHPVLSIAHLHAPAAAAAAASARGGGVDACAARSGADGGYWLATGDTAGDVGLWWVPLGLHGPAPLGPAAAPPPLRPVLVVRGVHQSGVNALCLAAWPPPPPRCRGDGSGDGGGGGLAVVSGGDDQALSVLHLSVRRRGPDGDGGGAAASAGGDVSAGEAAAELAGASRRPLAHASALRGVEVTSAAAAAAAGGGGGTDGLDGGGGGGGADVFVSSVGLDQVLRLWRLRAAAAAATATGSGGLQQPDSPPPASPPPPPPALLIHRQEPAAAAAAAATGCKEVALSLARPAAGPGPGPHRSGRGLHVEEVAWAYGTAGGAGSAGPGSAGGGESGSGGGCGWVGLEAVGGSRPLVLDPLAATELELPEPACLAALALPGPGVMGGAGLGAGRLVAAVAGRGVQLAEASWG